MIKLEGKKQARYSGKNKKDISSGETIQLEGKKQARNSGKQKRYI